MSKSNEVTITAKDSYKALSESCKAIVKASRELGSNVQSHLLATMTHVMVYQDARPALQFLTAMQMTNKDGKKTSVVRANAIQAWLQNNAFCRFSEDKATKKLHVKVSVKALAAVNADPEKRSAHIADAKSAVWNKVVTEQSFHAFDLVSAIESLITRAEDKALDTESKDKKGKGNNVPADKLAALRALIVTTPTVTQ